MPQVQAIQPGERVPALQHGDLRPQQPELDGRAQTAGPRPNDDRAAACQAAAGAGGLRVLRTAAPSIQLHPQLFCLPVPAKKHTDGLVGEAPGRAALLPRWRAHGGRCIATAGCVGRQHGTAEQLGEGCKGDVQVLSCAEELEQGHRRGLGDAASRQWQRSVCPRGPLPEGTIQRLCSAGIAGVRRCSLGGRCHNFGQRVCLAGASRAH
mmetsp:Transcript_32518/g.101739  ORF Transcript_32518/g.101739 Transcript_32518/m.101739 type:complete len:209 (-) Transcript_32518:21-647(-)